MNGEVVCNHKNFISSVCNFNCSPNFAMLVSMGKIDVLILHVEGIQGINNSYILQILIDP